LPGSAGCRAGSSSLTTTQGAGIHYRQDSRPGFSDGRATVAASAGIGAVTTRTTSTTDTARSAKATRPAVTAITSETAITAIATARTIQQTNAITCISTISPVGISTISAGTAGAPTATMTARGTGTTVATVARSAAGAAVTTGRNPRIAERCRSRRDVFKRSTSRAAIRADAVSARLTIQSHGTRGSHVPGIARQSWNATCSRHAVSTRSGSITISTVAPIRTVLIFAIQANRTSTTGDTVCSALPRLTICTVGTLTTCRTGITDRLNTIRVASRASLQIRDRTRGTVENADRCRHCAHSADRQQRSRQRRERKMSHRIRV
jgi:hypothetical protein